MQNEANFAEAPWNQGLASESRLQPNRSASEKRTEPHLSDASWHLRLSGSPAEGLTTPSFTKHETPITNHEGAGAGVLAGSVGLRSTSPPCRGLQPAVAATISCAAPGLTRSTLQAKKRNEPNSSQTTRNPGLAGESPLPPHRAASEKTKRTQSRQSPWHPRPGGQARVLVITGAKGDGADGALFWATHHPWRAPPGGLRRPSGRRSVGRPNGDRMLKHPARIHTRRAPCRNVDVAVSPPRSHGPAAPTLIRETPLRPRSRRLATNRSSVTHFPKLYSPSFQSLATRRLSSPIHPPVTLESDDYKSKVELETVSNSLTGHDPNERTDHHHEIRRRQALGGP